MEPHLLMVFMRLTVEHNHGGAREHDYGMEKLAARGLAEWNPVGVWQATEKGRALVARFCQLAAPQERSDARTG